MFAFVATALLGITNAHLGTTAPRETLCGTGTESTLCRQHPPDSACRRIVAVCLFGVNRSLRFTIASIRSLVLEPLRLSCFATEIYAHIYSRNTTLQTARSEEAAGIPIGGAAEVQRLLSPLEMEVTDQDEFLRSWKSSHVRLAKGSAYNVHTTRNLLCQLHSLARATKLWLPRAHVLHAVIFVRPDLRVLQPIDLVALAGVQPREIYLPYWACWGGFNDRFAFGSPDAAAIYGLRALTLERYTRDRPLHSERLLRSALLEAGVTPRFTSSLSVRIRASGQTSKLDKEHVENNKTCIVADRRKHCLAGRCQVENKTSLRGDLERQWSLCGHVPEYGATRRQVLVVLHGGMRDLQERAPSLGGAIFSQLHEACVVFRVVAFVKLFQNDTRLMEINGTQGTSRDKARTISRNVGIPLHNVMFSSSDFPLPLSRPTWKSNARRWAESTRKSSACAEAALFVLASLESAHVCVVVALRSSLGSKLHVPSVFLVKEEEVFVWPGRPHGSAHGSPLFVIARANTARALISQCLPRTTFAPH